MNLKESVLEINELTWYINSRYGIDLSMYRSSCMRRRVIHRFQMVGCRNIDEYFAYLDDHPGEIEKLKDIVTIHVTGFFRDRDVFQTLEKKIFPGLIDRKIDESGNLIRIWSAGCSTGEETYSLAILLNYLLRKRGLDMGTEIFGTDLSGDSMKTARIGVYSEEKITEVPVQMKSASFVPEGKDYRISNNVRELVNFRVHNLFSPPFFSMLDLIVCRNVLIHFDHDVRGKVISWFHSALRDSGILILGKSEVLDEDAGEEFEMIDPRSKVYRKKTQDDGYSREDEAKKQRTGNRGKEE